MTDKSAVRALVGIALEAINRAAELLEDDQGLADALDAASVDLEDLAASLVQPSDPQGG